MSEHNKTQKLRENLKENEINSTEKNIEILQDNVEAWENTADINSIACSSKRKHKGVFDRDQIFVIVDSSCESNPSSREILISNNKEYPSDNDVPKYLKKPIFPIDIPSTSKEIRNAGHSIPNEVESTEESQVIDINLQSDNELQMKNFSSSDNDRSVVLAYLKNKDKTDLKDGILVSSKKKSSLLNDIPKLETILESEQVSMTKNSSKKISENSLDVHIPSFPGSPRSLDFGSEHSNDSEVKENQHDSRLKEAIEFLHADKDLLVAAETGNDQQIEMIFRRKNTDIQQMDHIGRNALHLAVHSDNLRAIQLLLEAGVNTNIIDSVGMTPLSLCLMRRPSLIVVKLLFDYGAKLMPRSSPMDTGLFIQFVMMSIPTTEEKEIMKLLIQKGALINDPEAPGYRQPLHFAAMSNNCTLIRILVELGADIYLTNHRNETPREVAATFDCYEAYDLLSEIEELQEN